MPRREKQGKQRATPGEFDKRSRVYRRKREMLLHYQLIIYWSDDDQAFLVEVPELPGCMADGETYEAAVANGHSENRDSLHLYPPRLGIRIDHGLALCP